MSSFHCSASAVCCHPSRNRVLFLPKGRRLTRRTARCAGGGFTLIELLVVVAVIAVLAGITLAALGGVNQKTARDRTKAEISAIANALEAYRSQHGDYPDPAGNTVPFTLVRSYLAEAGSMVQSDQLVDPFGVAYVYTKPGQRNPASFDLYSTAGDPGKTNGFIGNW